MNAREMFAQGMTFCACLFFLSQLCLGINNTHYIVRAGEEGGFEGIQPFQRLFHNHFLSENISKNIPQMLLSEK